MSEIISGTHRRGALQRAADMWRGLGRAPAAFREDVRARWLRQRRAGHRVDDALWIALVDASEEAIRRRAELAWWELARRESA